MPRPTIIPYGSFMQARAATSLERKNTILTPVANCCSCPGRAFCALFSQKRVFVVVLHFCTARASCRSQEKSLVLSLILHLCSPCMCHVPGRGGRSLAVLDAGVVNVYQGANAVIFMLDPYRPDTLHKVCTPAGCRCCRRKSSTRLEADDPHS